MKMIFFFNFEESIIKSVKRKQSKYKYNQFQERVCFLDFFNFFLGPRDLLAFLLVQILPSLFLIMKCLLSYSSSIFSLSPSLPSFLSCIILAFSLSIWSTYVLCSTYARFACFSASSNYSLNCSIYPLRLSFSFCIIFFSLAIYVSTLLDFSCTYSSRLSTPSICSCMYFSCIPIFLSNLSSFSSRSLTSSKASCFNYMKCVFNSSSCSCKDYTWSSPVYIYLMWSFFSRCRVEAFFKQWMRFC